MERIRKSKIEIMELEYAMEKLKEDNRKKENDTIEHIKYSGCFMAAIELFLSGSIYKQNTIHFTFLGFLHYLV